MLTFLRKIRRSMIESLPDQQAGGSAKKYAVYAIGEITLVVVGILIALQVNNWNENRKERKIETISLISLKEEFVKNRTDLKEHINWKQSVQSKWDAFFMTITNRQLPDNKRAIRRPIASFVKYNTSNSTLRSLLSSGKIDNLRNDSLKYLLSTWKDVINQFQQFQDMHGDFVMNELMHAELNLFPNYSNSTYGFEYNFQNSDKYEALLLKAHDEMNYQNILLRNLYWINIQLVRIRKLERKMDQIIQMLENEIDIKEGRN